MNYIINADNIPTLAVGFSQSGGFVGPAIRLVDGGLSAVGDKSYPNHGFPFTRDHGVLFASQEDASGINEDSLADYCKDSNRIICIYYWTGWDDPARCEAAETLLAKTRAEHGAASRYNFQFLWRRLPIIGKLFWGKAIGYQSMVCSEECAWLHMQFKCPWATTKDVSPKQWLDTMQNASKTYGDSGFAGCRCILGYYK